MNLDDQVLGRVLEEQAPPGEVPGARSPRVQATGGVVVGVDEIVDVERAPIDPVGGVRTRSHEVGRHGRSDRGDEFVAAQRDVRRVVRAGQFEPS